MASVDFHQKSTNFCSGAVGFWMLSFCNKQASKSNAVQRLFLVQTEIKVQPTPTYGECSRFYHLKCKRNTPQPQTQAQIQWVSLARSTPKTVTVKVKTCGCLLHTKAVFPSVPNEKSNQYQVQRASEPTASREDAGIRKFDNA